MELITSHSADLVQLQQRQRQLREIHHHLRKALLARKADAKLDHKDKLFINNKVVKTALKKKTIKIGEEATKLKDYVDLILSAFQQLQNDEQFYEEIKSFLIQNLEMIHYVHQINFILPTI